MISYVAIDVESPNRFANSICSIALVKVENGKIIDNFYSLVNPETTFDPICINVHGITPEMVQHYPNFLDLWSQIESFFTDSILAAHNATYDLSVIAKTLANYGIIMPNINYLCTMNLTKKYHQYESLSLNDLCTEFNIPLFEHHNALADATACADLLNTLSSKYDIILENEIVHYNSDKYSSCSSFNSPPLKSVSQTTITMQEFKGIAKGIILDQVITDKEIICFQEWIENNMQLKGHYPFDKISEVCKSILADGIITTEEKDNLFSLLTDFVNPSAINLSQKVNICFSEKVFCLTGNFTSGSKEAIKAKITSLGGICKDHVVKNSDYLIVGGAGSDNWKFGNYGSKVQKALEMQDNGHKIKIIREDDFLKCL